MRHRTHRTMLEIYKQLRDCYFRHAFRMSYDSFVMLYNILDQYMNRIIQRSPIYLSGFIMDPLQIQHDWGWQFVTLQEVTHSTSCLVLVWDTLTC